LYADFPIWGLGISLGDERQFFGKISQHEGHKVYKGKIWLSRFWRDDRLLKRAFAANFADFRGLPKKNSRKSA
jgi:hypothetical protein